MPSNAFFTFFIDVKPRLDGQATTAILKDFEAKVKATNDKIDSEDNKNVENKKRRYAEFFKSLNDNALIFTRRMTIFTSALGALANMKFNNISSIADDLKSAKQGVFDILNASNKIAGVSQANVVKDIQGLYEARREQKITGTNSRGQLNLIGASLNEDVGTIMSKYRSALKNMSEDQQKIITERLGFSQDMLRVARLNDNKIKELSKLGFYNRQNIQKLEQASQATKELFGSLGDVKDRMIISFSPLIIELLSSIRSLLDSVEFNAIIKAIGGFGSDLAKLNKALAGLPFKSLLTLMALDIVTKSKTNMIIAGITGALVVLQDIYHGIKNFLGKNFGFLGIDTKNTKKSVSEGILTSISRNHAGFDAKMIDDFMKNDQIKNVNNTNNSNKKIENKTNINININGNATRNDARAIAREMNKAIANNNYKQNMLNDKR